MNRALEVLKLRTDEWASRERKRRAADSRAYADSLREKARTEGNPVPHCCGESGFGQADTDICPACEDQEGAGR
jgi:hypothetical protein